MADVVDPKTRSRMMAGISGKDTRPELVVRRSLHAAGFRYRLNVPDLPGRPDLVLPRRRAIVFIHGCFWHRHGCRLSSEPSSRRAFWREKFARNVERDRRTAAALRRAGWRVLTVWECALRGNARREASIARLVRNIVRERAPRTASEDSARRSS